MILKIICAKLGIILGLSRGKPLGVMFATRVLLKFFYKNMLGSPEICKLFFGIALLCGIGFTMSFFIVNLSFSNLVIQEEAKMGILIVSILSGLLGYLVLRGATRKPNAITTEKITVE